MSNNNFFLYNRKYFAIDNVANLQILNKELFNTALVEIDRIFENSLNIIPLKTKYPGLLIGSGYGHDYKHESENMKNEAFKIGFHFDFATGMPIIPGSSIKGMLRSCFPQKSVKTKKLSHEYRLNRNGFITDILKNKLKISCDVNIDALEDEIFHGMSNGLAIPIYERDIFFDAIPVSVLNSKNQLLDDDYITPHVKENMTYEMAMLKNPEPLKFLKVSPEVVYRFEFKLNDSRTCRELTAIKKLELFEYILLTLGIGAKTNVGYGQFSLVTGHSQESGNESGDITVTQPASPSILDEITKASDPIVKKIQAGSEWTGLIKAEKNDNFIVEFLVEDQVVKLKKKKKKIDGGTLGSMIRLRFKTPFDNDNPDFSVTVIE